MPSCCMAVSWTCMVVLQAFVMKACCSRPCPVRCISLSYANCDDLVALAAAYTAGITSNHPFTDGNKRTAFVVGVLFIELNGMRFMASEEAAAAAMLALASGAWDEAAYAHFLRLNAKPGPDCPAPDPR